MKKELNILIVEDERIVAQDIKQNLEKLGYEVPAIVSTAKLSFQILKNKNIHLILMDIKLSKKSDGISLAKKINTMYDIPIVYLTAYADKQTLDRAIKTAPYGYILKPFKAQELQSVIETSLYKHQIEKKLRESEKRYKLLYHMVRLMCDNVPDLIWAKNLNKQYIFTNKAMCQKLLNAKNTYEPIDKDDMYFVKRERESHANNPDYHTFGEICIKSDDTVMKKKKNERFYEFGNVKGKFLFLDVCKAPFWDENGKMIGTVGCGRDVTNEKQLEEERKHVEKELRASHEKLLNLTAHLQSVREEERTRVAREIHDELGQALTALKMDLSWLSKKLLDDQKPLIDKTKAMASLIDKTTQTIKRISSGLRPGLLDDLGLIAALEWEAQELEKRTGIYCQFNVQTNELKLKEDITTAVFRIFQETLTNITRHADATRVYIRLKTSDKHLELVIQDNGKGITDKQIKHPKSFGIMGMNERAEYLGGKIAYKGIPNKGTTVHLSIPL